MKRILISALALCLIVGIANATVKDTKVSASTVSFSTVGTVVSFNSVTNYIRMWNASTTQDCYADIRCRDSNGMRGYLTRNAGESATIFLPKAGSVTSNVVELNFSTQNLGFISDVGTGNINYVVTGDQGDL